MKEYVIVDGNEIHEIYRSNCTKCKYFDNWNYSCLAFPETLGIPDEILSGDNEHLEPFPGQKNNITFQSKKKYLKNMSGMDLFEYYTSQGGEYSQTLMTAYTILQAELFPMLEKCLRTDKMIHIKDSEKSLDDMTVEIR